MDIPNKRAWQNRLFRKQVRSRKRRILKIKIVRISRALAYALLVGILILSFFKIKYENKAEAVYIPSAFSISSENIPVVAQASYQPQFDHYKEVAKIIRVLESSGGEKDGCLYKGKINGYGYAPGTCYDSHEEVLKLVIDSLEKNMNRYTLSQTLCRYNTGSPLSDCDYYQKYLRVYRLNNG